MKSPKRPRQDDDDVTEDEVTTDIEVNDCFLLIYYNVRVKFKNFFVSPNLKIFFTESRLKLFYKNNKLSCLIESTDEVRYYGTELGLELKGPKPNSEGFDILIYFIS